MKVGYVRVSSADQDLAIQIKALEEYGVHITLIPISNHLHPATILTIFEHGFLLALK